MINPTCTCVVQQASTSFPWPTAIPAFISALVAVIVGYVVWQQWRTAREKLRLDLYNRRFEIYEKYLDLYIELATWPKHKDDFQCFAPALKAQRESLFLFKRDSGIYEAFGQLLELFYEMNQIENTQELGHEQRKKLYAEKVDEHSIKFIRNHNIEGLFAPYLNFHNIR